MANQVAIEKEILDALSKSHPHGMFRAELFDLSQEADNPDQISYALNVLMKQKRVWKGDPVGKNGSLWYLADPESRDAEQTTPADSETPDDPENVSAALEPGDLNPIYIDLFRLRQPDDCLSDSGAFSIQELTVEIGDGGAGHFAILKTDRWACSADELRALANRIDAVIDEADQVTRSKLWLS